MHHNFQQFRNLFPAFLANVSIGAVAISDIKPLHSLFLYVLSYVAITWFSAPQGVLVRSTISYYVNGYQLLSLCSQLHNEYKKAPQRCFLTYFLLRLMCFMSHGVNRFSTILPVGILYIVFTPPHSHCEGHLCP